MNPTIEAGWAVLKFGGTSVSSRPHWDNIAGIVRNRLAGGERLLLVHSALPGVTDKLDALLDLSLAGSSTTALGEIRRVHETLAAALEIALPAGLERQLSELQQVAAGIEHGGEVSDRVRARVMAAGELMSTELGAAFLNACGIVTRLEDARTLLQAEPGRTGRMSYLSATCDHQPDTALKARLDGTSGVILTQGFIASDQHGDTVLLGRGGSDTSAAYLAARLDASRLEVWSDVPGLFSANPRQVPGARLLKALHYDEAQEIATSGARVLHPRCIMPLRRQNIPLHLYATQFPDAPGTLVSAEPDDGGAQVKAIALRNGITLVSMDSPGMWHQVGFLADAFAIFKDHGLSVDLVSTSETNVTVSLDPQANALSEAALALLAEDLGRLCRVRLIGPCSSLSLLGRNIRAIIHRLGGAFELFEEHRIYLVSQAANDLNFTFVIDQDQGDRLVGQLHDLLIQATADDHVFGPTWEQLTLPQRPVAEQHRWWRSGRARLLATLGERDCAYVYDLDSVAEQARALAALPSVKRVLYAIKANSHPGILRRIADEGLSFECVSPGEVSQALKAVPGLDRDRLMFTPNFAPREEYRWALEQGLRLTVDNLYVLQAWPELFRDRELFVRIDTGYGHGHHRHVRTAGVHSKFGIPLFELEELGAAAGKAGARIVGLHAHTGSGNFDVGSWRLVAERLAEAAALFGSVRTLDLGGGLGVPDRPGRPHLDLPQLQRVLREFNVAHPGFDLWLEPGRYVVSAAGVLLARVTQLKGKGAIRYLGVATGMNSLIRPALYGAFHEIVNLTRLDEPGSELYTVVGPICESGDVLGHDRLLPPGREGDVMLFANAGAYGHVMGSSYNLRPPAEELLI